MQKDPGSVKKNVFKSKKQKCRKIQDQIKKTVFKFNKQKCRADQVENPLRYTEKGHFKLYNKQSNILSFLCFLLKMKKGIK